MILQPARIVLIDDNPKHLKAIADALGFLGSASLSFLYSGDIPEAHVLAGARLVFCDLHLNTDAITSDGKAECSHIVGMLDAAITEHHGPYLLIIWSQFPDRIESLPDYLEQLAPEKRPFHHTCLDKNHFIDVTNGTALAGQDLPGEIQNTVSNQPGLAAMLSWEQSASFSAARATNLLWQLSLNTSKKDPDQALCKTLGKLAAGAAGVSFGTNLPGRSVLEALVPLLADQIEAQGVDEALWKNAVDVENRSGGAASEALYTALHLEVPTDYRADKRGSVSPAEGCFPDDQFKDVFGFDQAELLKDCGFVEKDEENSTKKVHVWKASEEAVKSAKWFLVQVNAACDEAQNHPGLLPYCLAFTIPSNVTQKKNHKGSVEKTNSLYLENTKVEMYLLGRFIVSLTVQSAQKLQPEFRIRTALLDKLVFGLRTNAARLGVTEPG